MLDVAEANDVVDVVLIADMIFLGLRRTGCGD